VVWFTFKLIIGFSRIFLLETASVVSNHDVNLFRGLKMAFLVGGVLTVCTMLVHQLPVPFEVRDFFNRLFMVFLLAVSVLLLKSWQVVPSLLAPYTHRKRPYVQRLIRLLSFLIPLTLLATSLIGLSGYVDFAWAINRHIGIFLLIFAGYILVRGFLIDTADWTSELFIQHVRSGWMWSQAILKPLEMVLKLALFLFAIICLFWVYGWDKNSLVIQDLHAFFYLPLFHLAGSLITPLSIIKFIVVLCIFWWAVRWSREFSYRVLFASTKDVGVRNSLAVFMQYTMVVIGFFVILWVLGISVIALAAVLTLFGVGIAFGLRDLFKNYVSGFFLLMERPVKKGDYVTINGNEGQVGHIGLRSFTVVTGDHMELLVPNSEIFDKPFTNWTSQDNIVRTVISIKINRVDDPHAVCDMIMDILTQSPDIVAEPCSQVLLKDIGDALIELEVRYHINLEKTNSRALVRSDLLFKIWDKFKELGIKPPHPQHDIYIKSVPEGTELK
jgi:potassium efflux system protein